MCLYPVRGEVVKKRGEEESEDVTDEESDKSDKYVNLPVLRGRQLVVSGSVPSWRDYRVDHASVEGRGDISSKRGGQGRGERKLENDSVRGERRCVEKVMLVTETVYDTVIQCHHSYHKRCHTTYVTGNMSQYIIEHE